MLIQSTARGNEARKRQLKRYQEEEDDEELSDAAELIQSAVRGHWGRKKYINTRLVLFKICTSFVEKRKFIGLKTLIVHFDFGAIDGTSVFIASFIF